MAASLENVQIFWQNADAHALFLHRVAAAIVETAQDLRDDAPPSPVTGDWCARQYWAVAALDGADGALLKARQMLPALAVTANDAGLLNLDGTIDVTDSQIRGILTGTWIDMFTGYVPEAA